jgi:hypothetical protein
MGSPACRGSGPAPRRCWSMCGRIGGIENGLHGRQAGTLKEDASRVRKGVAAQVMALLRNLVIYLCSWVDQPSLAAATRHFMCHPSKSVELVSTPI